MSNERFMRVALDLHFNNVGTSLPSRTVTGRLNVWGNSLAADRLPSGRIEVAGVPFQLPDLGSGKPDNVRCEGQYIGVQPWKCDWIYFLATAERRAEDEIALHFADGWADFEPLRVSDFWASAAAFGEQLALTSPVMHYPHHVQQGVPGRVWLVRVPVVRMTELAGFRLPSNVAIHLFAATLCESVLATRASAAGAGAVTG
jgi:hypothetical protein